MKTFVWFLAAALALAALPARGEGPEDARAPVVVELFTSQGCPACPPADAYMHELARRDDVIALEFHIDYYDYGGWIDPFGRPHFTWRWQQYARAMGARYEYTPFMVIGGAAHEIGSQRGRVEARIREQRFAPRPAVRLDVRMVGHEAVIRVDGSAPAGLYDVLVATYDRRTETAITGGENVGHTAVNVNVVRGFERVGQWAGERVELTVPLDGMPGDGGCAILLQRAGGGPIAAAVNFGFPN